MPSILRAVYASINIPNFRQTVGVLGGIQAMSPASNPTVPYEDKSFSSDYCHKHRVARHVSDLLSMPKRPREQAPACERALEATCEELGCDMCMQTEGGHPQTSPFQIHIGRFELRGRTQALITASSGI